MVELCAGQFAGRAGQKPAHCPSMVKNKFQTGLDRLTDKLLWRDLMDYAQPARTRHEIELQQLRQERELEARRLDKLKITLETKLQSDEPRPELRSR